MKIHLTSEQQAFVRRAVESGRFARAEDAVAEALLLWEERERRRAEILLVVDKAEGSLARGEGHAITRSSMKKLATGVKQRGRRHLAAGSSARR